MKRTDNARTGWFVAAIGGLLMALNTAPGAGSPTVLVAGGILLCTGLLSALR